MRGFQLDVEWGGGYLPGMTLPYRRCFLVLADGARPDIFEDLLERGQLPAIQEHIVGPGTCTRAVSVFPSTTGPAYLPFLTGCFPGPANMPGIRWFDRQAYQEKGVWGLDSCRSYVGPASYLMNRDFNAPATLFELFDRPVNIFSSINRGIGFSNNKGKILRSLLWLWGHYTDHWDHVDQAASAHLLRALRHDPDFVFCVFPGMDEYGHLEHPLADRALGSYHHLDHSIGQLADQLRRRNQLDDTLFLIVSDHGLSSTHTHCDPVPLLEAAGLCPLYYPKIFRRHPLSACMVSGNAMGHLYFRGPNGWNQRCTYEDLRSDNDLISYFTSLDAISFVASKDRQGHIRINSKSGEARIHSSGPLIEYHITDQNPLDFAPFPTPLSHRDSLSHTFSSEFPDAPTQLLQIFQSPRCGDLILNARPGFDLRDRHEHPEHHGSHGSLHRDHMLVPLLTNHPLPNHPLRSADIFPSILKWMDKPIPPNIDGEAI